MEELERFFEDLKNLEAIEEEKTGRMYDFLWEADIEMCIDALLDLVEKLKKEKGLNEKEARIEVMRILWELEEIEND